MKLWIEGECGAQAGGIYCREESGQLWNILGSARGRGRTPQWGLEGKLRMFQQLVKHLLPSESEFGCWRRASKPWAHPLSSQLCDPWGSEGLIPQQLSLGSSCRVLTSAKMPLHGPEPQKGERVSTCSLALINPQRGGSILTFPRARLFAEHTSLSKTLKHFPSSDRGCLLITASIACSSFPLPGKLIPGTGRSTTQRQQRGSEGARSPRFSCHSALPLGTSQPSWFPNPTRLC